MTGKLEKYLPPKEHWPEKIYALPELHYPRKNVNLSVELLEKHATRNPNKPAILFEDQVMTYGELLEKVNKLANALRDLGIEKDDRVMLRSSNVPEYIIANFACWRIGAIPVLCNHLLGKDEIVFRANDSEAKAIIVNADYWKAVEEGIPEYETLEVFITFHKKIEECYYLGDIFEKYPPKCDPEDTTLDDFSRLIYSSGTTGKPKGILCTIGDVLAGCDTHAKYVLKISDRDIIGGHPYFTFAFGSVDFTMYPWRFGATLSIIERFTPEKMFETIEKHKITVLCCVPTAFRAMLNVPDAEKKYDLSSVRIAQSAGEHLPASTYREWKRRFGIEIINSLGSSDWFYCLSTFEGLPDDKAGSTGIPVPGFECKIVDENFNEVPPGEFGELVIRGPVGPIYWCRPDKQSELIVNGWVRTENVYMRDEDGYFWFLGRTDDIIVTSGYKIPGGEVENILMDHPAVQEVAVVGSPDETRGNIVKAYVVLRAGYKPSEDLKKELQELSLIHI